LLFLFLEAQIGTGARGILGILDQILYPIS
jgi:hypothetical protein